MTADELRAIHEEYRRAVEAARDETLPEESRAKAGTDLVDLRHKLDAALIEDKQYREDQERVRSSGVEALVAEALQRGR